MRVNNEFKVRIPDFIKNFVRKHKELVLSVNYYWDKDCLKHVIKIEFLNNKNSSAYIYNPDESLSIEADILKVWYEGN